MNTSFIGPLLATAGLVLALAHPAAAQGAPPEPVMRWDVTGSLAWIAVSKDPPDPAFDSERWHHALFGGAGAGLYWTDHHKTEIDFGASREDSRFSGRPVLVNGFQTFAYTDSHFSRRTLGISQQYQFFRNQWFHPHVAAGANVTWERVTDHISPVVVFDRPGPGREIQPARTEGPRTDVTVSPFIATGFKAYMTTRGFFRSDLRVAFRGGVDDALVRVGFGIDF